MRGKVQWEQVRLPDAVAVHVVEDGDGATVRVPEGHMTEELAGFLSLAGVPLCGQIVGHERVAS